MMYYGEIKKRDIANGSGVRCTLFVSGCTNKCKNCFQPQTWNFCYGQPFDKAAEEEIMAELSQTFVDGLTLLGGDPFEPRNQRELLPFVRRVKKTFPQKNIWAFTGFVLDEELLKEGTYPRCEVTDEFLSLIDVLVDGRYVDELNDISLQFRGSSNQRLIDLKKTLNSGRIVLWDA